MIVNDFWYFGCERVGESGHYLFTQFARTRGVLEDSRMGFPVHLLDGTFAPVVQKPGHWRLITIRAANDPDVVLLKEGQLPRPREPKTRLG